MTENSSSQSHHLAEAALLRGAAKDYWSPIIQAITEVMLSEGTLTEGEVDTFLTDSPEEAVTHIDRLIRTNDNK